MNSRKRLQTEAELERSDVVANSRMNRDRSAVGVNSYARELRFSPIDFLREQCVRSGTAAWLDLCCGTGKALLETAAAGQFAGNLHLVGVDLIDKFHAIPPNCSQLQFVCASLHTWTPNQQFDLITCVHGLHYVGDKLDLITRSASWLNSDGLLIASLDLDNLRNENGAPLGRVMTRRLKQCGIQYDRRKHLLVCRGRLKDSLSLTYLGADDSAGPNYSGQEAVNSYYRTR